MTLPSQSPPTLFGIRHHGPGSARSLRLALTQLQPDIILIEGPPEATEILHWLGDEQLQPPIALLIYNPDHPRQSSYFPFAIFSPELQAIRYALNQHIPVRFIDIPQAHRLALSTPMPPTTTQEPDDSDPPIQNPKPKIQNSPSSEAFHLLATAAGYPDHESWWNRMVEERQESSALFTAVLEVMTALREEADTQTDVPLEGRPLLEEQREASMRQNIRQAQREGFQKIAVVCGAWHTPALRDLGEQSETADQTILATLQTMNVNATWVPWTYGRLSMYSGYGAGIQSPGWYHHLWEMNEQGWDSTTSAVNWLTKVARLLRSEELDASSAHIIEAVRLAESLAALRDRPVPGLLELNEAIQTVLCFGDAAPLQVIRHKLIVSDHMGSVPAGVPKVPLQRDLDQRIKRLKLRIQAEESTLKLDLRKPLHLERSHLIHRLNLLNLPWGTAQKVRSRRGTFNEVWKLLWRPDFAVQIIEASMWGNTIHDAAEAYALDRAEKATDLPTLTALLDQIILAELPHVIAQVMAQVEATAATSNDIPLMMDALPPLAQVLRYGNVRQTDTQMVRHVVDGLLTRICVGLPQISTALADKAAQEMNKKVTAVNGVVNTIEDSTHTQAWRETLNTLADKPKISGLIAGKATRLLHDVGAVEAATTAQRMRLALSPVPTADLPTLKHAVDWLTGFLEGTALLLIHDHTLWNILDSWVTQLPAEAFRPILPLLRRTFAQYSEAERQQLSDQVKYGRLTTEPDTPQLFDEERANQVLPLVAQLLGLGK